MPTAFKTQENDAFQSEEGKRFLEAGRLKTFEHGWPHSEKTLCSSENMARAGFYYTGQSDCVKCFVCQLRLHSWEPEVDNPWDKHIELSKNCIFAKFRKDEGSLSVEQWLDIFCGQALYSLDKMLDILHATN